MNLYLGHYFDFEMSSNDHKTFLTSELNKLLEEVDKLLLHPKNKLLVYQRYILSKLSWHPTVTELNITLVKQNLDNVVNSYIQSWLEMAVSGTLHIVTLSYNKYGLNIHKLSTKFTQCQVTFRLCLRNSINADIRRLYNETSKDINVQYDTYKNTREVIKDTRLETKDRIENELTTQKLVIKSI